MKKFVAFVMILSLGMFCAIGCGETKKDDKKGGKPAASADKKDDKAVDAVKPEGDKPAADKPAETK